MELFLLKTDPVKYSSHYFGPGFMVDLRGQALFITQCPKIHVPLRPLTTCYKDLGVYHNSKERFVDTSTKIIIDKSTQVDCLAEFSIHFIGGKKVLMLFFHALVLDKICQISCTETLYFHVLILGAFQNNFC